jgi:HSP20 family molecular chaperone IbpA
MSRLTLFNSPLLLGFDQIEQMIERLSKSANDGYPPYNIEQISDTGLRITLAVAGFARDDLAITVEGNQLVIRGKQKDEPSRVYLHRGIAARQFQRVFLLAEGIEVSAAQLDNGLLSVDLARPRPETRVRTVAIDDGPLRRGSADGQTIELAAERRGSDKRTA